MTAQKLRFVWEAHMHQEEPSNKHSIGNHPRSELKHAAVDAPAAAACKPCTIERVDERWAEMTADDAVVF
ncbi:hypothetical protein TRIUR3_26270 [Triticum urartu]|uniref:Uncharacterized protein n=1 Tax=Triticum urartu TaxID=4572 RepID=M7ZIR4_TRIUA|nr:hypothetical protein TRIUR3_26270 [Triticum urartu]